MNSISRYCVASVGFAIRTVSCVSPILTSPAFEAAEEKQSSCQNLSVKSDYKAILPALCVHATHQREQGATELRLEACFFPARSGFLRIIPSDFTCLLAQEQNSGHMRSLDPWAPAEWAKCIARRIPSLNVKLPSKCCPMRFLAIPNGFPDFNAKPSYSPR